MTRVRRGALAWVVWAAALAAPAQSPEERERKRDEKIEALRKRIEQLEAKPPEAGQKPAPAQPPPGDEGWVPLFNGKDFTGWDTYLGPPKRGETPPIGLNTDPRGVFGVAEADGAPAIRISGEVYGVLVTREEYENYHLRVEFKWGDKKWYSREQMPRDSGILYHSIGPHGAQGGYWMKSFELNIEEKSCGDFWSVAGTVVDVEGRCFGDPKKDPVVFKKGAPKQTVRAGRIVKRPDAEKPTGEWNVVELFCFGDTSVHVVNGQANLVLTGLRHVADGKDVPLTKGKIQIQSEGAEVFYRRPEIRPITEIPARLLQ